MPKLKGKGGKKGKRKKAGKAEPRVDKETEIERAKASAALWESRLKVTESSRVEYREAARNLAQNNEELTRQQYQLEKDMVDVIGFLKNQDMEKDELIEKLQQQLIIQNKSALEEREKLVGMYSKQIADLEEKCTQKANEMLLIQTEFRKMREFRRQKVELEKELEDMKENLKKAKREHQDNLASLERRFFEEKQRLEKEAEKKIMILAEKAHSEAIMQLDEAGRSVFKENVRLKEAFSYHMNEVNNLKKAKEELENGKELLLQQKEINDLLVQEKVLQASQKKAQVQELQQKIKTLEHALNRMTLEIESEVQQKEHQARLQETSGNVELQKLQKMLEMKEREMNRVKKLARNILEERTEVEHFFLEALGQVKQEIISSRNYYRQVAQSAYHSKMLQAASGTDEYPKVRTFHNKDHSTNDVNQDLQEAEKWSHIQAGKVDIRELTWEQKERVLRLLFAKMNGFQVRKKSPGLVPSPSGDIPAKAERGKHCRESEEKPSVCSPVFITQHVPEHPAASLVLPNIHTGRPQVTG
ncbi:basal body-orientation factor 1 [Rhinophrynus dorsalis]